MSRKNKRQTPHRVSSLAAKVTEFNPDYSVIKRDLKRIGLLAGTFLAILIFLAIFQNPLIALFIK
jgi:hypothetical protein